MKATKLIKVLGVLSALLISGPLLAQKVNYKAGLLQVDGKDVAKIVRIKDKGTFGLTGTYELYAMNGEKLIIATLATNFAPRKIDNSSHYFNVTFLSLDKVSVFSFSSLGPEKSFAKMVGESGIVVDNQLDGKLVSELIAKRSEQPEVTVEYHMVKRERSFPVKIKDYDIVQQSALIGRFREIKEKTEYDTYEFVLPDGLVVATVRFSGGNNAKNCTISTNKDRSTRTVSIAVEMKYLNIFVGGEDRNTIAINRIATWLVSNRYM